MELLQLRYFKAVAENESLTQTANKLFISPPSLSSTISRLEKELGTELFDRHGNRLHLNTRGYVFLECVNQILSSLDNTVAEVRDMEAKREVLLSVATTSPNVWIELFSTFQLENPEMRVTHTSLRLDELKTPGCLYKYDFVIASPTDVTSHWKHRELLYNDDYPVLLVHPDHPLSKRREISLAEVKDEPFVALTPGFSSRKYFDDLCERTGFTPKIAIECDYMMRSYMVMKKIGVALATAYTNYARLYDGTCCIDITEPVFPRVQALFRDEKRHMNAAAARFQKFATNFYPGHSCRKTPPL